MKNFILPFVFLLLAIPSFMAAQADDCVKGEIAFTTLPAPAGELLFEVYLKQADVSPCGAIYLGFPDINFNYNEANFTNPTLTVEDSIVTVPTPVGNFDFNVGYCSFVPQDQVNGSPLTVQDAYNNSCSPSVLNGQFLLNYNVLPPNTTADAEQKLAYVTTNLVRVGRYRVTGYNGGDSGLELALPAISGKKAAFDSQAFTFDPATVFSYRVELSEIPLPVTVSNFEATPVDEKDALVTWSTSSEVGVQHFELLRSRDTEEWAVVTELNARGGENTATSYDYMDLDVHRIGVGKEVVYYQLKAVDYDGTYTLSDIKAVTFGARETNNVSVHPNPAFSQFTIKFTEDTDVDGLTYEILNVHGQSVKEDLIQSLNTQVDVDLAAGVYFVRFKQNNEYIFSTQKLMIDRP